MSKDKLAVETNLELLLPGRPSSRAARSQTWIRRQGEIQRRSENRVDKATTTTCEGKSQHLTFNYTHMGEKGKEGRLNRLHHAPLAN